MILSAGIRVLDLLQLFLLYFPFSYNLNPLSNFISLPPFLLVFFHVGQSTIQLLDQKKKKLSPNKKGTK
jgi:hypothetical protein